MNHVIARNAKGWETMPGETVVPLDDRELMSDAMAEAPVEEAPQAQPEPEQRSEPERPRDDKGRFVAQSEPEKPQAKQVQQQAQQEEPKDDQNGQVPAWRLRELREARDAADRRANDAEVQGRTLRDQMSQMQRQLEELRKPKVEPVEFFQDPEQAFTQRISPLEQRLQSAESRLVMRASRAEAVAEHGRPAVVEMEAAVEKAMQSGHPGMAALRHQMLASDHPVGVAMDWYKQNSLYERTGGDLDAYVQKQLDAKLKDPEFLAKAIETARAQANGQPRPSVQIPPSLSKATGSGGNPTAATDANEMSDANLYGYATAKGGR